MARKLKYIAQDIMNVYYQEYKSTSDFFDIEDFVSYAGMAYMDFLSKEYDAERTRMRSEGEENIVSFSHDWLQTQIVKTESNEQDGYFAKLEQLPMSFPYDSWDSGIRNVFPLNSQYKKELIRGKIDNLFYDEYLPISEMVTWSLIEGKLILRCGGKQPPSQLKVIYIPSVSENLEIPQTREKMIMDATIQLLFTSAQKLIKETNNQNSNKLPQTESDRNLIKA